MKVHIPDLPDDASTEARFLAIARAVVHTTPAEAAEREQEHEASKEARGVKKRGPKKGAAPKHKRKD